MKKEATIQFTAALVVAINQTLNTMGVRDKGKWWNVFKMNFRRELKDA